MPMNELASFIRQIPKAELHVHLEGSIFPKTLLELARRNSVKLPFDDEGVSNFYGFESLGQFLEKFEIVCSTLRTSEDFSTVTLELGADSARQNIPYREVFFTFFYHKLRGVKWDTLIDGLSTGCNEARRRFNVEIRFIANIAGPMTPEEGIELVELAHSSRNEVPIIGIGLGSRKGNPLKKHKPGFRRAKELDFHCVSHAGEDLGPWEIWEAIKELEVERVDHGVRAIEDDELKSYLVEKRLPLTVCPVSNVKTKNYPNINEHPIKKLMDAGVLVTVNSDDPAMFGSDLIDNYVQVAHVFGLGPSDVELLALNSIDASFLEPRDMEQRKNNFLKSFSRLYADIYGSP